MTVITAAGTLGAVSVLWWLLGYSRQSLRQIVFRQEQNQQDIDGTGDGQCTIEVDHILAIQICALRIKVGGSTPVAGKRWGHHGDALEVNIIWQEDAQPMRRETLFVIRAEHRRAVELAQELADRLGKPLLNHATRMHWLAEKERARERPWAHCGVL